MRIRSCLVAGLSLAVAACGTVPMTVITGTGHTFRGTVNVSVPTTFQFSDGRVTCSGRFPSVVPGDTHSYTVPLACNRGLTGIAIFSDVDNLRSGGGGILRLSDGTSGTFITGAGAAAL